MWGRGVGCASVARVSLGVGCGGSVEWRVGVGVGSGRMDSAGRQGNVGPGRRRDSKFEIRKCAPRPVTGKDGAALGENISSRAAADGRLTGTGHP